MISDMCSISSSSDDVAETAASAPVPDRMVKIEMEAAEALANLSQPAKRGGPAHFGGNIAGKAKRGKRQVKCDSPPSPAASLLADSAPSCSDLAQDPTVLFQQQDERNLPNITKVELEPDDRLLYQSHICSADLSVGGGKSSQNLSEFLTQAEKEAKRLRRVLANRESARRTIRRRQALCEELARKAAELTEENEKLKKGKESALREYELLESTNKNLKAKVEKVAKLEGEKTPTTKKAKAAKPDIVEHIKPSQTEMLTTSPANLPMLVHNAPFAQFMWPTLFQSSNAGPSIMHASHTIQASCNPDPSNEQSTVNIAPPVYIIPFPLFMGRPDQVHHCQTSCCHEPVEINNQQPHLGSSSSNTVAPDGEEADVTRVSKGCGLSVFANDLNEIPADSPPLDESAQPSEAREMGDRMTDAGSELHLSLPSGKEDDLSSVPSSASNVVVSNLEKHSFLSLSGKKKKLVDVTAAAEARRRRKELKKLKAIHGGQCRMRCCK